MYGEMQASGLHWTDSFHMYLSYLEPILLPCSPYFLHFPSASATTLGILLTAIKATSSGSQFWEPSFTFGGQKLLMAVTFLVPWSGKRYFHFTVLSYCHKVNHIWEAFHDFFFFFFLVPWHCEAHSRSSKGPHWYVKPVINFWIRPIDK